MTCHCEATDHHFGPARAQEDLEAYRRRGATGTARRLLRLVGDCQVQAETLLDIGAGVGILHHELLARGVGTAMHWRPVAHLCRPRRMRLGDGDTAGG
jgi:hypothetical protein